MMVWIFGRRGGVGRRGRGNKKRAVSFEHPRHFFYKKLGPPRVLDNFKGTNDVKGVLQKGKAVRVGHEIIVVPLGIAPLGVVNGRDVGVEGHDFFRSL